MIYGSGGGSLDKNMVNIFRRLYDADGTLYEYNVKDPVFNYEDDVFTYTPEFVAESQWAGTLASVYETTVFDKAVGWSRWIRLNRQEPSLWSKSGFDDELDDDDL